MLLYRIYSLQVYVVYRCYIKSIGILISMEADGVNLVEKLTNILMPEEEEYVETEEEMTAEEEADTYQVANGSPVYAAPAAAAAFAAGMTASTVQNKRPKLTVHTTKVQEMSIDIHVPQDFDQVRSVADGLKENKACIVNYEKVEAPEQRRICDFLNGVCYVLDGDVRRISETMVLYVPNGVDISGVDAQENIY